MRLDKLITDNSNYSRSQVAKLIKSKLVLVNGLVANQSKQQVSTTDNIKINNEDLFILQDNVCYMLNKASGYVCSHEDYYNNIIYDILPDAFRRLNSVGRLDVDTTGLVLLTNNGQLLHRLTSPNNHVDKVYLVSLLDPIEDYYKKKLLDGITLRGDSKPTLPAKIEIIDDNNLYITICEGRYHQVKRMFAALGNKVIKLHRCQIASIRLPVDLLENQYRKLSDDELNNLLKIVGLN